MPAFREPTPYAAYRFAVHGSRLLFGAGWAELVRGGSYIPATGPALILANHESYFDPLLVCHLTWRPIVWAAKEELFEVWHGWLFPRLNCIPVKRGTADRALFRRAGQVLANGGLFGLFPEGTRSPDGEMQPFQAGALAIAARAGVPIVPVGIAGTFQALPRQGGVRRARIGVQAGRPLRFAPFEPHGRRGKRALEVLSRRVWEEVARLRAEIRAR
jgi:1-acyl-sn-glycerol-3-phosphate acyltransferase